MYVCVIYMIAVLLMGECIDVALVFTDLVCFLSEGYMWQIHNGKEYRMLV